MGLTASQIRQDLFCFGEFGQQGYGYKVDLLREEIGEILGISQGHTVVVLGAGNLGRALMENFKFASNGFQLLAAFDVGESVVGTTIGGVNVYHVDQLEEYLSAHKVSVGLLTLPQRAAQGVADRLVAGGESGDLELHQPGDQRLPAGCGGGKRTFFRQPADAELSHHPAGGA